MYSCRWESILRMMALMEGSHSIRTPGGGGEKRGVEVSLDGWMDGWIDVLLWLWLGSWGMMGETGEEVWVRMEGGVYL